MRLFVALDFPDAIRNAIGELVQQLKPLAKDARWVEVKGMHVTLKFIGHAPTEQLEPIVRALRAIRLDAPVEMRFRGVGFFPTERRPRIVWCGIEASPNLADLAARIERELLPLGIPAETRPFTPHLTLGRLASSHGLDQLVQMAHTRESLDFGTTREAQFHLFESVLKPSGAEYTRRQSFPFAQEPA